MWIIFQDIAAHTRVTPMQRQLTLQKFVGAIKSCADSRQQLEDWGLYLEDGTIDVSFIEFYIFFLPPQQYHFFSLPMCSWELINVKIVSWVLS